MEKPNIYSGNLLIWVQISQRPSLQVGRINGVATKRGFTVFLTVDVETKKMNFLKMFTVFFGKAKYLKTGEFH